MKDRQAEQPPRDLQVVDDDIDLARLWGTLVDHKRVIALVTAAAVIIGFGYLFQADPVYQADALLQVEQRETGIPGLSDEVDDLFGTQNPTDAEIEIIRSRMVLGTVVDELRLDLRVEPKPASLAHFWRHLSDPQRLVETVRGIRPAENAIVTGGWGESGRTLRVAHFRVPEEMLGQEWTLRVLGSDHFQLWLEDSLVIEGPPGEELTSTDGRVELRLLQLDAPTGSEFRLLRLARWQAIEWLRSGLSVSERGRDTGIVYLTMKGEHPQRIRAVLDAIARTYLLQNIERRSAEAAKSLAFLEEQTPRIRSQLDAAEQRLNQYRTRSESVDLSLETQAVLDKMVEVEARLSELQLKESELRRLYTRQHPNYKALLQQRGSLEAERARLD